MTLVLEQLNDVIRDLLVEDPRRVVLGEDVREGTPLGLTRAAAQEDDTRGRLLPTPLCPASFPSYASGLAVAGTRPIAIFPTASALLEGLTGLREAGAWRWRSGDHRSAPALFLAPIGPGFGVGGDDNTDLESALATVPGLSVASLGPAATAAATLRAAAALSSDDGPRVLLMPRTTLLQECDTPSDLPRGIGRANWLQRGEAATVFAWGAGVDIALRGAERSNAACNVVDLVTLSPLDRATAVEAAQATGKIVICHGGPSSRGVAGELAALCADQAILHLDAPVLRVSGAVDRLAPHSEHAALPTPDAVAEAIERVAHY